MATEKLSLRDRVAVVTGGGRGIGRAIALAFAEAGAAVVVGSRTMSELEAVVGEVQERGGWSLAVRTDIASRADIENLVAAAVREFGTVDILVNNALTNLGGPILDLAEDIWDRVMNTDLKGYLLCSQVAGRVMREKRRGNIVNMISGSLYRLCPRGAGAYMVAKAGVAMLTKVLAAELGEYNIRCNAIAPGVVKTGFSYPLWSEERVRERWEAGIPLGRMGEPDELAQAAVFLASDASSYVTGVVLTADGGIQV